MLKSTYTKPQEQSLWTAAPALPDGWTEHTAPTGKFIFVTFWYQEVMDKSGIGHSYYYNAVTQESTYTRPQLAQTYGAETISTAQVINLANRFTQHEHGEGRIRSHNHSRNLNFEHGQHNSKEQLRPRQHRDRPKSKKEITDCAPWILVHTRLGRRFVFNPETNTSLWKFPADVMQAVIRMDSREREQRQKLNIARELQDEKTGKPDAVKSEGNDTKDEPGAARRPEEMMQDQASHGKTDEALNSDEEYEEVEVTDDEDEEQRNGAENLGRDMATHGTDAQPVEFNEDDIAYQLQAMGQDYGLDPGEYGNVEDDDTLEPGAEGLPLSEEEARALFNDLLDDLSPNPYRTWESIIEAGLIIDDDRYTVLNTMKARKEAWAAWSQARIQQLKKKQEQEAVKDPRIPYFAFLESHATPKLYWPEFRRKYQREAPMRSSKLTDKDREKWYREYIGRSKLPESTLKGDLLKAVKACPLSVLNKSSSMHDLPGVLLTNMHFISLRPAIRDPLLEAYIESLPEAPDERSDEPSEEQQRVVEERARRHQALADRAAQVQQAKRTQRQALDRSKAELQQGGDDLARAMKVGRQGLLSHREDS